MPSRHAPKGLAAVSAVTVLLAPAAAGAATKPVHAALPLANAKGMPPDATGNAFYPRTTAVRAGDKVAFKLGGLHNVVFAAKGEQPPPFHGPDPARPVAGVKDPAGADLWFNGQPGWFIEPTAVIPTGDTVVDGGELESSGVFQGQGAPPDYVVTFPKQGRYRYLCTIHRGMKGTVDVLPKRAAAPSARKHAKAISRQAVKTVASAKRLAKRVPAGHVVRAGNDRKEVAFFAFSPAVERIAAGQSVRFEMARSTTEIHNVVFGPEAFLAETAAKFISPGPQGIAYDPLSVYPSDPGELVVDGTNHGNGFASTGLLDRDPGTSLPAAKSVTFAKPGRYGFICTVHGPSMKGTIEVQ